jgi:hypothetical protein
MVGFCQGLTLRTLLKATLGIFIAMEGSPPRFFPQVSFVSFTAARCYNIGIIRHFLFRFYGLRLFLFSSSSTVSDKTVSAF